jgi:hypothetical protein
MQPAHGANIDGTIGAPSTPSLPAPGDDMALDDVRREFGDRWDITRITGGYRAIPRDSGGHTPIPRYGRTPGELAESIRMMEPRP